MSSSLSFRNSNTGSNNNSNACNARGSQRYSLKDKVASASDSVLKGLNLAALRSEEISDDSGSFEEEASGRGGNKYVEVGVNELYRHKLNESIAIRRSSDVMSPNPFEDKAGGHSPARHIRDDEKVDDIFISSMAKLDNDISPARKARARQRRRDSLQSLASIERRVCKSLHVPDD